MTNCTHMVLCRRHWPAMLSFVAPGDDLILGGEALYAALTDTDLPAVLARHQVRQAYGLTVDAESMGLVLPDLLGTLDDDAWVQLVAQTSGGLVQW